MASRSSNTDTTGRDQNAVSQAAQTHSRFPWPLDLVGSRKALVDDRNEFVLFDGEIGVGHGLLDSCVESTTAPHAVRPGHLVGEVHEPGCR